MSGNITEFDPRIMKIVLIIGNQQFVYEDNGTGSYLYLAAKGAKYANPVQNECTVRIGNLSNDDKNYILTRTSPYYQTDIVKQLSIFAGRVSTGYSLVYTGDITNSKPTQPPDVFVELTCKTLQSKKGTVKGSKAGSQTKLSAIAAGVASDLGLQLNFQATDKYISNYAHSGSVLKQVNKLTDLSQGQVSAYVDDNTLVVKPMALPLPDYETDVSASTGMVGIPETTEEGTQVKFLFNNNTKLGGAIKLTSELNPSVNGYYVIYKLEFDLANRETPFYYIAQTIRVSS